MTDNWNPNGPIVVWENYGIEGWQPRSYTTLAEALAKGGVTTSHVITTRVDIADHVKEPEAPRHCKHCGKSLVGKCADALFCSGICRTYNNRAVQAAERPNPVDMCRGTGHETRRPETRDEAHGTVPAAESPQSLDN